MSCDGGWLEYKGQCFNHYSKRLPWSAADGICEIWRKAILATVEIPEINTFVHKNLTRGSDVWIGLSIFDISKPSWKWSDGGNTSSYNNWNNADVTSACAVMKYDEGGGYWYTSPCTHRKSYICEKEMSDENCSGWLWFDTHCYIIIDEHKETNMAAARNCWLYGAHLISINSLPESDFIYSNIEINEEYWIGLSPLKWVNDAPYQWNNWGDSGPNHNITYGCVYMDATHGKWFCGHCGASILPNTLHPYICQSDAVIDFPTTPSVAVKEDTHSNAPYNESSTLELNVSNTHDLTDHSKQLLLTAVVPSVCGGLVVVIVIIVVVIFIRRKRRRLAAQDANPNEQAIYYNDIKKTKDNGMVKRTDTNPTKTNEPNQHIPTEDSHTPLAGDTERNTYEQLSVGPYFNSGQITAGTYASLQ